MLAAIAEIKKQQPKSITVAVPVSSKKAATLIQQESHLICIEASNEFHSLSEFYLHFDQVSRDNAVKILKNINQDYT